MTNDSLTDMEHLPEDVALAIEIIRQLENLDYTPDVVLQAMIHVCRDTLKKLPGEEQKKWRAILMRIFQSEFQSE